MKLMHLIKFFLLFLFLSTGYCLNYIDPNLLESIQIYIDHMKTGDYEKFYEILTESQKNVFKEVTYQQYEKKLHYGRFARVGGYIKNIEQHKISAKVEVEWRTLTGKTTGELKFVLENGKWKFFTSQTKESFETQEFKNWINSIKIPPDAPKEKLTLRQKYLLLTIDDDEFFEAKKILVQGLTKEEIKQYMERSYKDFIEYMDRRLKLNYTEEELSEIVAFFETQAGLKYLENYRAERDAWVYSMPEYIFGDKLDQYIIK